MIKIIKKLYNINLFSKVFYGFVYRFDSFDFINF